LNRLHVIQTGAQTPEFFGRSLARFAGIYQQSIAQRVVLDAARILDAGLQILKTP